MQLHFKYVIVSVVLAVVLVVVVLAVAVCVLLLVLVVAIVVYDACMPRSGGKTTQNGIAPGIHLAHPDLVAPKIKGLAL